MADAATTQLVNQIVQEFVQARRMFTAFDVTTEARRRNASARHNDVKDVVHDCFQQGRMGAAYNRSTIDVGAPVKPFLYHHFSDDPNSYQSPGSGNTASPPASPANPGTSGGFIKRIVTRIFGDGSSQNPPTGTGQGGQPPRTASAPSGSPQPGFRQAPAPPKKSTTLGLDAAQFLPISRDELIKAAKGIRLWSGIWWGRRDLIPPTTDNRTTLIDRGMLAQGLLSAEQLAEIHSVGAEMDRVRPVVEAIRQQTLQAGQAAVEASREDRAKLREQKKAEAATKKKLRAEQIAYRRATDIVFLGRGVSGRLGERTSDVSKLTALALPVLQTPSDVANALGLSIPQLRGLAFHSDVVTRTHYIQFSVPKKSGGTRTLSAPHQRMAKAQKWILLEILSKLPTEDPAHGFIVQRSILTNAQQHVGKDIVINMDLEGFFPSITFPRVRSVFHRAGYSPAVATILALLCTECPRQTVQLSGQTLHVATGPRGLPQGAYTSPAISNQVARRLDKRLLGMARKNGLTYTRYADDLTISCQNEMKDHVGRIMARVRHLAEEEGFRVNESKSRIQRRNTAQMVTGLVVNERPGVPRTEVKRLRAILHRAQTEGLEAQNRDNHPNFTAWVDGMIAYISMSKPDVGDKLRKQLQSVRRISN